MNSKLIIKKSSIITRSISSINILFTFLLLTVFALLISRTNVEKVYAADNQGQIIIETDPIAPKPGDNIKIKVVSYSLDADLANIVWQVDGKTVLSGTGETIYKTTVPVSGEQKNVIVQVTDNFGNTYNSIVSLGSISVNLSVESADGYTPAWYKGAKLIGEGSKVRVTANPEFKTKSGNIPNSNLYYSWTVNDNPLDEESGVGRSSLSYVINPVYGNTNVKVVVKSLDGSMSASGDTNIQTVNPRLYVYNYSAGSNPKMLGNNYKMQGAEESFTFEPFFASASSATDSNLKYDITLGGIPVDANNNTVTIRAKAGSSGSGSLDISYEHIKKIVQSAKRSIVISFSNIN